jgi:hypothetical protein
MATVWSLDLASGTELEQGNVIDFPEDTNMSANSFRYMQPVKLTTSGTVEDALDSENIFGFALLAATGTANTSIPVLLATRDQRFVASQSTAGATQVTVQTQVGLQCSWILSAITSHTTKTTIDTADTNNLCFEIIQLDTRDDVGTADGRVIVRLVPDKISAR